MSQSQRAAKTPLVSIGMPVFNGEGMLEETLRSVLVQTLDDFELIICDNASGDRTAEICRDHAAGERRIRYFRNSRNLGQAVNHNLAFSHARGRYFKWLAADERLLPSYLASTRRVLDERPDVVLCNTLIGRIDSRGIPLGKHDSGLARADLASVARRFAWVVSGAHSFVDFFGLIRTQSLLGSLLHAGFPGAERALLAQLALRGRLAQLPAPLLQMREYPHRSPPWQQARASLTGRRLRREYLRMIAREALPLAEHLRCFAVLACSLAGNAARDTLARTGRRAAARRTGTSGVAVEELFVNRRR